MHDATVQNAQHAVPRCCSTTMGWVMLGLQGLLLALLVFSRPFAWAPTVKRLWARRRTWRRVKVGCLQHAASMMALWVLHFAPVK